MGALVVGRRRDRCVKRRSSAGVLGPAAMGAHGWDCVYGAHNAHGVNGAYGAHGARSAHCGVAHTARTARARWCTARARHTRHTRRERPSWRIKKVAGEHPGLRGRVRRPRGARDHSMESQMCPTAPHTDPDYTSPYRLSAYRVHTSDSPPSRTLQ